MATIYLAGGCFWGVEKYMASVRGVINAEAGYANGMTQSPTYRDVSSGRSGYTETVKVDYDPAVAPLPFLLDLFFKAIDPTSVNRQGNDVGTQYRSGIYYSDPADRPVVERALAELQARYDKPIAVEAEPLKSYTSAEDYHQDYLDKNPGGYCHITRGLFEEAAKAVPDPSQFPARRLTRAKPRGRSEAYPAGACGGGGSRIGLVRAGESTFPAFALQCGTELAG